MADTAGIIAEVRRLQGQGVAVAVFPELSLTGYSIEDLLMQDTVLQATTAALDGWLNNQQIIRKSRDKSMIVHT